MSNRYFLVCVPQHSLTATFQFNYFCGRKRAPTTKHLQISSEACSTTHSPRDSFKLSQAHACFSPSLPIITRHSGFKSVSSLKYLAKRLGKVRSTYTTHCFQVVIFSAMSKVLAWRTHSPPESHRCYHFKGKFNQNHLEQTHTHLLVIIIV